MIPAFTSQTDWNMMFVMANWALMFFACLAKLDHEWKIEAARGAIEHGVD